MLVKLVKHCEVGCANIELLVNSGEVISMTHVLQILFLSVFILQVVIHGEESQVPGDLRQSEILIEQDFKI
jgi:hypothetical protein